MALIKNVVIYGAGEAGKQLFNKISDESHSVVFFLDDDPSIVTCCGLSVLSLSKFTNSKFIDIDEVYFAISAISEIRRAEILNILIEHNYIVKLLPLKYELKSDRISVKDIKIAEIEDLIDRSPVQICEQSIMKELLDEVVLITGAAGSIGSELLEQILKYKPKKIIALDSSELGIYNLELKISDNHCSRSVIKYVLGSVLDNSLVDELFSTYKPTIVYHAAAYKHVPLVESNPIVGVENNFFGTINIARAAQKIGAKKFILISTDKSVRPTNVMGCSKRLAEIYIQTLSSPDRFKGNFIDNSFVDTVFSMVRFGNVVGSSGSVIPLFEKQIISKRYLTVTDCNVTRFFMSIPEAVKLVLQSSTMCEGGDVFLLNMGTPVKILDLAIKLIKLRGFEPVYIINSSDSQSLQNNQIGILFTGLRPGEKLYEELLIDSESLPTFNTSIFRANEGYTNPEIFDNQIKRLSLILEERSIASLLDFLVQVDIGYSNNK
jgi:FlaA1/EpsC-like NDP-sugar epimerase